MSSFYETLQVPKTASQDDIKRSYKHLARQHHPDKGGDTNTFQKIQEAYETLSDEQKRAQYDAPKFEMPRFGRGNGHANFFDMFMNFGFEQMNIQMNRPRNPLAHVFHTIKISLEQVFRGISTKLVRAVAQRCESCMSVCHQCRGQGGILRQVVLNGMIIQPMNMGCDACGGSGLRLNKQDGCNCKDGRHHKVVECKVDVPGHQMRPGCEVRFPQLGEQANSFLDITSDFVVNFEYDLPKDTTVVDRNVSYTPTIGWKDLLCGTTFVLPKEFSCLTAETNVKIPPMSLKPNTVFENKGKGLFQSETARGDLYVVPKVCYEGMDKVVLDGDKLRELLA